jgi:tRNA nucleotidyltransferase (CCA-adding enzyme)
VEEDLARRDLTVNAMARHVLSGETVDPFDGITDLRNGVLRHVSEAFCEDPLRVLRVARFAAKFGFTVADETVKLCKGLASELTSLKAERVWAEVEKVLECERADLFFRTLAECGVLHVVFPEVAALNVPDRHDGTAFEHTMRAVAAACLPHEKFGCLVHDFGKGQTPAEEHPRHLKHESLGVDVVSSFCKRLRVPNELRDFGVVCCEHHMVARKLVEMKSGKVVRFVLKNKRHVHDLLRVCWLETVSSDKADFDEAVSLFEDLFHLVALVLETERNVTGRQLLEAGFTPGPKLGEVLFSRRVEHFVKLRKERSE